MAVNVADGVEYSPLGDSVEMSFDVRNRPVAACAMPAHGLCRRRLGWGVKKTDPDATVTYYVSENHEVIDGVHTTYEFLGNVRFAQARGAEITYFRPGPPALDLGQPGPGRDNQRIRLLPALRRGAPTHGKSVDQALASGRK
jgi:hypothetical protein